jgi:hypothetical protein
MVVVERDVGECELAVVVGLSGLLVSADGIGQFDRGTGYDGTGGIEHLALYLAGVSGLGESGKRKRKKYEDSGDG